MVGKKFFTVVNKEQLDATEMGKVEKRIVKTTDGKDMLTWVIYPPDFDPEKKYPALLYCQGGPQSAVSLVFFLSLEFSIDGRAWLYCGGAKPTRIADFWPGLERPDQWRLGWTGNEGLPGSYRRSGQRALCG